MARVRIAGAVLLVLLGAGLLSRITDHRETPPKKPASVLLEVRAVHSTGIRRMEIIELKLYDLSPDRGKMCE